MKNQEKPTPKPKETKEKVRRKKTESAKEVDQDLKFIRLPEATVALANEIYPGLFGRYQIEKAVAAYHRIRALSLAQLRGIFSRAELTALVDSRNGYMLSSSLQGSQAVFMAGLEDAETLSNVLSRHGAELESIRKKITAMHPAQIFLLEEVIDDFWRNDGVLAEFLDKYAAE